MTSAFITATGTDIGKTHITCALLAHLAETGVSSTMIKPLMSGFSDDDLAASDAGRLLAAMGRDVDEAGVNALCMARFEAPLAPNVAARAAGKAYEYDDILAFVNARGLSADGPVLVEGAGGVMSPVTDEKLHADLISDLAMPAFLVTANYLGGISHTLSALEVMNARAIPVLGVIVSQPTKDHGAPDTIIKELSYWVKTPMLAAPFGSPETLKTVGAKMARLMGV
mgnify:CR=1 FL=1